METGNYVDEERRQIAAELHAEILPGTEVMADVGSHHFVKGAHHQVLVPQPSDDPNDPLNWSIMWKLACITSAAMATFSQGFGPLALGPMFPALMEAFDCSLADAVQLTGVCILVLGFSNFIWVPISTSFGRRPVYLFSQLVNFGTSIWRAKANSYGSFMGACIVNGMGAGPSETIMPEVIADIFFLHDRGKWNTLYWVTYMGSLMVGPIVAGAMTEATGWRSFWWLNTAVLGLSFIMIVFMFPETRFKRAIPEAVKHVHTPTVNEKTGRSQMENLDSSPDVVRDPNDVQHVTTTVSSTLPNALTAIDTASRDPYLGHGTPGKWQWKLFQPNAHPFQSILFDLRTPWKLFAFPIVEFAAFVVSWSCSIFLTVNLTQSQVLASPPYNFKPMTVGLTNFAVLVGAFIGLFTAGPLSDWVSTRSTRRNNGIREPEMRLLAMIPYVIIMYVGNTIVAVGYQKHWPWQVIVMIGYTCAGIQVAGLPAIVSTYAVDSYKPVAGSLFVAITVNKNVWGYGFSKFVTEWSMEDGFIPTIMTNGSIALFFCLFGVLFWWKGKTVRRWSKNSNVHKL
ncbi:serine/threonine kinase 16 [Dothidotthia symphoricarpi CBS 119687]|uniref:Serine/threonine kinase 16 n=1 Tax=Dothidotthia symphoricarpi CBS 119687 TaxID=1392245 RepID=A0A6A6AHD9_9PLEO|nr:serine/threonine kinase 16 [Dothidotthia symphoricarpi CBS 119687]KAF2130324.1 serine/threonine kinase 16 [Dothidotthia symphoricarpi CBS 119687]